MDLVTQQKYGGSGQRYCTETVELVLTQGQKRAPFPQIQNIIKRPVVDIRAHSVSDVTKTPNGLTPISAAAFKVAYLVITNNGMQELDRIPLIDLQPSSINGRIFNCDFPDVDWQKSYVEFGDETAPVTGTAIYFMFGYYKKN